MKTYRALICLILTMEVTAMADWKLAFEDDGTKNWEANWFLDGKLAAVTNTPAGMILKSGPLANNQASSAVLWTKQSFAGDIRIEYDYTRLDKALEHLSVCILYVHATGVGKEPYVEDIFAWRHLREKPDMPIYFNYMKLYHVSYACTGGDDNNYIRARCYPNRGNFDKTTRLEPSYENVDLFHPGETWHLVFEKIGTKLTFTATKGDERHEWKWDAASHPPITGGRIGLRQMRGRESRYANFKVFLKQ